MEELKVINKTYAKAYTEVLEIIRYFPEEEYKKIPQEKIEYYKENMDQDYKVTINPEIDLAKQNISKEASVIIVTIFRDYFATEEQKEKLEELIELSKQKSEIEKREKYNPDDIFKEKIKKDIKKENITNLPVEVKKYNFFKKLIDYIRSLFM